MKKNNPTTTSRAESGKLDSKAASSANKLANSAKMQYSKSLLAVLAMASFLVPYLIGSYSIHSKKQLGMMDGMAEEYMLLGFNLYHTQRFQVEDNKPFFFKAPGYPYFLYYALKFYDHVPKPDLQFTSQEEMRRAESALYDHIYRVQNVVFSFTALIVFLMVLEYLGATPALFTSLLFSCNPYFIILVGLLHYEILHICLLILGTFSLIKGFNCARAGYLWLISSGLGFGFATLVRPITLILPLFVFIGFVISEKAKLRPAILKTCVFTAFMMLVIAPYTWRNYRLSGELIPVNAQGGIALWAGTVKPMTIQPNHYRWWDLWYLEGRPIYERVAARYELSEFSWLGNSLELDKVFQKEAYSNLRRQPLTYVYNVMINFISINCCVNSVLLKIFEYIQLPGKTFVKAFLESNNDQTFYENSQAHLFTVLVLILTTCSAIGIYLGIRQHDFSMLPLLAIYMCVTVAHSITYIDVMYYYVKLPFLFIFFAFFLRQVSENNKKNVPWVQRTSLALCGLLTFVLLINVIV